MVEGETGDDRMTLRCEVASPAAGLGDAVVASIREVTKLRGEAAFVAPGSLPNDGKVIGTSLIGQAFADAKYFWSRPSATTPADNAANSSGSNLGPTNDTLLKAISDRVDILHKADPDNKALIPVDLVTTSGSGLDPHISVAAANYQVGRVAKARGLPVEKVTGLVEKSIEPPQFGFLGEPRVNVLKLNLALEGL